MVYAKDIEAKLFELAPKELAYERDNIGLLVDSGEAVTKIMCALDITHDVIKEAIRENCNLIVAHHPVIYRPLYNVSSADVVWQLAANKISAICMHTNLDTANGGVNDTLAQLLNLQNVVPFGDNVGRIGDLPKHMSADCFTGKCSELFGACSFTHSTHKIKKVAVLGGAGADMMTCAFNSGADAFITGEAAHHFGIAAASIGKLLIAAGHFATEHCIVNVLQNYLQINFANIAVCSSKDEKDPFTTKTL